MSPEKRTFLSLSEAIDAYLDYCKVERELRPDSVIQCRKLLREISAILGDVDMTNVDQIHVTVLKKVYLARDLQPTSKALRFFIFRNLLRFCQDELRIDTLTPNAIKRPKIPKKRVEYLTEVELKRFFDTIGRRSQ